MLIRPPCANSDAARPRARDEKILVFVYGTLRRGQRNHALLRESRLLGCCWTQPDFTLLDFGPFPGVVEPGDTAVSGEVYTIDSRTTWHGRNQ